MNKNRFLILDTKHNCLVQKGDNDAFYLPSVTHGKESRWLTAITQWFHDNFAETLPSPCGQFENSDGMSFTFILPIDMKAKLPCSFQWISLAKVKNSLSDEEAEYFWHHYDATLLGGYCPPTRDFDVFSFGNSLEAASRLAHMVVVGKKRGTAFWVTNTHHDKTQFFPSVGGLSLVTDGFGYPRCFIETIATRIAKFKDVPREFAMVEGEGDRSFDDWRDGHYAYFANESQRIDVPFTYESEIFLEEFAVVEIF